MLIRLEELEDWKRKLRVGLPEADVGKRIEELLERTRFDVTESFASEMVLAKPSDSPESNPAVRIERLLAEKATQ